MYYRILPRSHVLRMAGAATQRGPNHLRTLTTANMRVDPTRPTTGDQGEGPRSKIMGLDREKVYIGGGLVAIGAIWYYYATVENARINRREAPVTGGADGGRTQGVEGTARSVKDRTKEALKSAQ
jgi:hypothetical protein